MKTIIRSEKVTTSSPGFLPLAKVENPLKTYRLIPLIIGLSFEKETVIQRLMEYPLFKTCNKMTPDLIIIILRRISIDKLEKQINSDPKE